MCDLPLPSRNSLASLRPKAGDAAKFLDWTSQVWLVAVLKPTMYATAGTTNGFSHFV
jgi:hypothetical protein